MRTLNFARFAIFLALIALVPGCKDDDKDPSQFVGNYVIVQAELAEALTVPTNESGDVPLPAGTDITQAIQTALLSAVTCSSADKSYVELREDFSLYLSCEGSDPLDAGTWDEVSATSLKLNLNNAAIPSSPTGFVLTVTEIVITGGNLTGKASVPLPKPMVAALVAPMQLTLTDAAPVIFVAKFSIEFQKK